MVLFSSVGSIRIIDKITPSSEKHRGGTKAPCYKTTLPRETSAMKAAYIEKPGPPESIIYGTLPKPKPGDKQVLVKVKAVAVNPVDTYMRGGLYPVDLPNPYILGCDLAGEVEAIGSAVKKFQPGDRVWGSNQGVLGRQGTFAEYAVVDECWLYPTPEDVPDEDAAGIAMAGITAHLGLFRDGQLKMGEMVFVNGGTGGVGSCVVQMARAIGAKVFATAGTDAKVRVCQQLGANMAANYKNSDLDEAIDRFGPIDVWVRNAARPGFGSSGQTPGAPRAADYHGGAVSPRPKLPVGPFYVKDCKIFGFAMFNAPSEGAAKMRRRNQSLDGPRQTAAEDRSGHETFRGRRST